MATIVKSSLIPEIQKYGAFDVNACFNCGNCTAVCPLSVEDSQFPRPIIRAAQLGLQERLLSSEEVWQCYYCGECSATCPRQAEPGEFMMAARRYAIANYDITGLGKLVYKVPDWLTYLFALLFAVAVGGFFWIVGFGPIPAKLDFFSFIEFNLIHELGLLAGGLIFLAMGIGIYRMVKYINKSYENKDIEIPEGSTFKRWWDALIHVLFVEVFYQKQYKEECEKDDPVPLWRRRWLLHLAMFWGFLGLLAATGINFVFQKNPEILHPSLTSEPLFFLSRFIGITTGLVFLYGTGVSVISRYVSKTPFYKNSKASDWLFLWLLFLLALSGFTLTILVYMSNPPTWYAYAFLFHIVVAAELLLLAPFTKFAHAFYRPIALWIHTARHGIPETDE